MAGLIVGILSHFAYQLHASMGLAIRILCRRSEHGSLIARALIGLLVRLGFRHAWKSLGWYRHNDEVAGIAVSAILALVPLYMYNQWFI